MKPKSSRVSELTERLIENLKAEISDLEDSLDRADAHGMGTFYIAKKLHEKRKELDSITGVMLVMSS